MTKKRDLIEQFGGHYCGDKPQSTGHEFDSKIAEVENVIGEKLPADYVEFVRRYGGYGFDAEPSFDVICGVTAPNYPPWTPEEDKILRNGWTRWKVRT